MYYKWHYKWYYKCNNNFYLKAIIKDYGIKNIRFSFLNDRSICYIKILKLKDNHNTWMSRSHYDERGLNKFKDLCVWAKLQDFFKLKISSKILKIP